MVMKLALYNTYGPGNLCLLIQAPGTYSFANIRWSEYMKDLEPGKFQTDLLVLKTDGSFQWL